MSKITETLRRFEEKLDAEAMRIEESIKATKDDIRESVENYIDFQKSKIAYCEFFQSKMEEFGVKDPDELDDEKKVEFFKSVDTDWTGDALSEDIIAAAMKEAVATSFKSDDPRESETPVGDTVVPVNGDGLEEPVVTGTPEGDNGEAEPEDAKVDDQTDVTITTKAIPADKATGK